MAVFAFFLECAFTNSEYDFSFFTKITPDPFLLLYECLIDKINEKFKKIKYILGIHHDEMCHYLGLIDFCFEYSVNNEYYLEICAIMGVDFL
jgi:hypothetical protein